MARKAGRKGIGKEAFVKMQLDKFSPIWWEILLEMLKGESKEDRRFAMAELNKLQIKGMPVGEDAMPNIEIKWL